MTPSPSWAAKAQSPALRPSLPAGQRNPQISSGFHSRAASPGSPNRLPAALTVPGSPLTLGCRRPPISPLSSASEPAHLRGGSRAARTQLGAGVRGAVGVRSPRRVGGEQRLERQTQSPGRGAGAQAGASSATRGHRSGPVRAPPPAAASRTGTALGGGALSEKGRGQDRKGAEGKQKVRVRTPASGPRLGSQGVLMKMGRKQWSCKLG